ncbi:sugar porter family MFS transporter [Corynebacterium epidermidicanis]|uniref:MFS transporter, sugar porter family n=1 Tax=Corynebacterium epidermidicanis TaxID=1050174 RepID=A0A0G3GTK3_9CORY|nr:sugar porter family MFS transporter [Corynebacterium epidermidicanis]AKK03880.1 MFS transporter, sugar porter family [Corynebacterium epidermidicanis]
MVTNETSKSYARWVAAISALGGLLFGYDTGVMSGALLYIENEFTLSAAQEGAVTSMLLVGAAIGALTGGRVADAIGRRLTLILGGLIFVGGSIACALAADVLSLGASRTVLGLAVGMVSIVVPMYISEMVPADVRGRLVSLNTLMIVVGQLVAFLTNSALAHTGSWRLMLGLAAVPGAMLAIGMVALPDSPVWLRRRGRFDDASRVAARLSIAMGADEGASISSREVRAAERQALRVPWIRRTVLIAVCVGVTQQVTGVNAIVYFAPKMMNLVGISTENAVYTSIIIGTVSVISCWIGMLLVDRIGRRRLLTIGLVGTSTSLVLLSVAYKFAEADTRISALVLVLMATFIAFQQAAVSLTTWLLLSELVPPAARGLGMGIAGLGLWVANWLVAQGFLPMVEAIGGSLSFLVFAVLGGMALVFVRANVPETTDRSLDDVAAEMKRRAEARY